MITSDPRSAQQASRIGYATDVPPSSSALNVIDARLDQAIDRAGAIRARLADIIPQLERILGVGSRPEKACDAHQGQPPAPRSFQDKTDIILMIQSDVEELVNRLSLL